MFTKAYNTALAIGDGRRTIIPLATDIQMVKGVDEVTFTRASGQYIRDFENRLQRAFDNKAAFPGMRRVENLLKYSDDFSNAAWAKASTSVTGTNQVNLPTVGGDIKQVLTVPISGGEVYRAILLLSGSGTITIRISRIAGGIYQGTDKRVSLTAVPQPFSVKHVFSAGPTSIALSIIRIDDGDTATQVIASQAQIENVTNQSNQNPSEYIPTTTTSAAKWFDYLNPNTVDANGVVTDSGVRTPITGGKGMLIEPSSTNKCTCYGVPRADALGSELLVNGGFDTDTVWGKGAGCTISGGKLNCVTTGTVANTQTLFPVGAAGKRYSVTFTVDSISSGGLYCTIGGKQGTTRTTPGTYTEEIQTISGVDTRFIFWCSGAVTAVVDNISVKECIDAVGTKAFHDGASWQNPITGMMLFGDTATVLSIVTDQAAIEAAGLAKRTDGYKVYKLDNSAGSSVSTLAISGQVGNLNVHTISAYARRSEGSSVVSKVGENAATTYSLISGTSYARYVPASFTPAFITRYIIFQVGVGDVLYFLIPQLEELPYCTSEMPTLGATATRSPTIASLPVAGNLASSALRHIPLEWTPWGSATGTTQCLWSSRLDANNYVAVWLNGTSGISFEKKVTGVSEAATKNITPVIGTTYKLDIIINPDNTLSLLVDGAAAETNNSTTIAPVLGSTMQFGSFNGAQQCFGQIKNINIGNR